MIILLLAVSSAGKIHKKHLSFENYQTAVIAETLWREARGEGKTGIKAVASVIYCRKKYYGYKSYAQVCLSPKQFSCWNRVSVSENYLIGCFYFKDSEIWKYCLSIAESLVNGKFKPIVKSDYYHEKSVNPYWVKSFKMIITINNHKFYASQRLLKKS